MQNLKTDYTKSYNSTITSKNELSYRSHNVDINLLLNKVKTKNTEERKKKLIILTLTILPIVITGLIIF
jgi:hypothetical protein